MAADVPVSYDSDFYGWIQHQMHLLQSRQLEALDIENLMEELDSLGRSERRALLSQITRLYLHLLKWHYQRERRSRSWLVSIVDARVEIRRLLADNSSFKAWLPEAVIVAYVDARTKAQAETGLPLDTFPAELPFSWDDAIAQELSLDESPQERWMD
ncbi:MAG: DUF29 domain-containing protein [Cyanobacteria bacterium]|nr:DUF29 domain-containing protein [Cyanobacteriota bacterium]